MPAKQKAPMPVPCIVIDDVRYDTLVMDDLILIEDSMSSNAFKPRELVDLVARFVSDKATGNALPNADALRVLGRLRPDEFVLLIKEFSEAVRRYKESVAADPLPAEQ